MTGGLRLPGTCASGTAAARAPPAGTKSVAPAGVLVSSHSYAMRFSK